MPTSRAMLAAGGSQRSVSRRPTREARAQHWLWIDAVAGAQVRRYPQSQVPTRRYHQKAEGSALQARHTFHLSPPTIMIRPPILSVGMLLLACSAETPTEQPETTPPPVAGAPASGGSGGAPIANTGGTDNTPDGAAGGGAPSETQGGATAQGGTAGANSTGGSPPSQGGNTSSETGGAGGDEPSVVDTDAAAPAGEGWPAPPLGGKKFVGNITARGSLPDDFAQYWDQLTPENESKWSYLEPNKDDMQWDQVDELYRQAQEHGWLFKLHTFVWGSQQPDWVNGTSDVRTQVEDLMRLACERYPQTALIDVVNEPPPHTEPTAVMAALGGAGESGYDWIVEAFRLARRYCPDAILIFNDYNNIEWDPDQDNFIRAATAVKEAGAPVDALGAQAHDAFRKTPEELRERIDRLAAVGLPLYITEYDIDVADDEEQARIMAEQFPIFWNDDRIKGITLWGYIYGATWHNNTGLIRNGVPRPAMTWLASFLEKERAR